MDRLKRDVILIRLIETLREQGSWCGETHIQKATYLLQEMAGVETGFEFILYKHGPFSFELRDELSAMRADGFISLQVRDPAYGPTIVPESAADALRKRFPRTLKENEPRIEFITSRVGNRPVVDLERLGTALYVTQGTDPVPPPNKRAEKVHELKPHVSVEEALEAVKTINAWRREARSLRREPSST